MEYTKFRFFVMHSSCQLGIFHSMSTTGEEDFPINQGEQAVFFMEVLEKTSYCFYRKLKKNVQITVILHSYTVRNTSCLKEYHI